MYCDVPATIFDDVGGACVGRTDFEMPKSTTTGSIPRWRRARKMFARLISPVPPPPPGASPQTWDDFVRRESERGQAGGGKRIVHQRARKRYPARTDRSMRLARECAVRANVVSRRRARAA